MTFNYIITCHNSEGMIDRVLTGVQRAVNGAPAGTNAECIAVLDGCTDGTAEKVAAYPWVRTVETPDVHELLSINAGLQAAFQDDVGFNIILQDDVILNEPDLEQLIIGLYNMVPYLGYVSLRLGVDFGHDDGSAALLPETHNLESIYGAGCTTEYLEPYQFAYRAMPIKSPTCLPCKLVREVGLFNPDLAPYAYDDAEYALRVMNAGYVNGVFAVPFVSDYRWGGTRRGGHPDVMPIAARNCTYIRERWQEQINSWAATHGTDTERRDWRFSPRLPTGEQRAKAEAQWKESRALLADVEHGVIKLGNDSRERAFEMLHKNQGF